MSRGCSDEELMRYNRQGLIPGPEESEQEYLERVEYCLNFRTKLQDELGKTLNFSETPKGEEEIVREAFTVTQPLYDLSPEWVPLFFSNDKLPFWQAGCAWIVQLTEEEPLATFFQLRKALFSSKHYFGYSRKEILAHELAHAGRMAFDEPKFEEFFAYQTAPSFLRRWVGPIIAASWESALFVFLLLTVSLLFFFLPFMGWLWALPGAMFLFGCMRLTCRWRTLKRCLVNLKALFGDKSRAWQVAYRLRDREITAFAKSTPEKIEESMKKEAKLSLRGRLLFMYLALFGAGKAK